MIQFKETGRIIEHVWSNLHECQLLDKKLDEVKKHLRAKYYVDYLTIDAINREKTHYISNMGHDLWHMFHWGNNLLALCPVTPKHFDLPLHQNRLVYFEAAKELTDYNGRIIQNLDLRAYYIQEYKEGYAVVFSNTNNISQFCFTFANNKHLGEMVKDSYLSLVTYLDEIAPIFITPFLEYFSRYNKLEDSRELEDLIKEYPLRY